MKSNLRVMGIGSGSAVPTSRDKVFVLLLKSGFLYVEECEMGREFEAAEKAGAGILGVFESMHEVREVARRGLPPGITASLQ